MASPIAVPILTARRNTEKALVLRPGARASASHAETSRTSSWRSAGTESGAPIGAPNASPRTRAKLGSSRALERHRRPSNLTISAAPPRRGTSTAAFSRIRYREITWRRSLSSLIRGSARAEQAANGRGRSGADRTVQWRGAVLVDGISIRAGIEQPFDDGGLRLRIPRRRARRSIGGVVQRLRAAPVARSGIGSHAEERGRALCGTPPPRHAAGVAHIDLVGIGARKYSDDEARVASGCVRRTPPPRRSRETGDPSRSSSAAIASMTDVSIRRSEMVQYS